MLPSRVADPADPRVALYRGVRDPELLQRHGLFIAEGRLVVERLLQRSPFRTRSVLVTPAAFAALHDLLATSPAAILVADPGVLRDITTFNLHRGCLALAERRETATVDRLAASRGPLLALENVGNPDNVGGAFRNAAAFGATGVILSPTCSDPLYRKAIRTSMGASLIVPFAIDASWPAALEALAGAGWTVVALSPSAPRELTEIVRGMGGARVAVLLGHEGQGLTPDAVERSTVQARIPMAEGADSLNVATAAAIALHALRSSAQH